MFAIIFVLFANIILVLWNNGDIILFVFKSKNPNHQKVRITYYGEPGGVRTPDPALRRRVLYPTELLIHSYWMYKVLIYNSTFGLHCQYYFFCIFHKRSININLCPHFLIFYFFIEKIHLCSIFLSSLDVFFTNFIST